MATQSLFLFFLLIGSISGLSIRPTEQKDCSQPRSVGLACANGAPGQKFYFDAVRGVCQPFMYRGCNGTSNRFDSAQECRSFCIEGEGARMMLQDAPAAANPLKAACRGEFSVDHLTPVACTQSNNCDSGYECNGGFCCPTAQFLCNLSYDAGKFAVGGEKSDRYFWDTRYHTCMRFSFYGSLGNPNNFPDYNSCARTCGTL